MKGMTLVEEIERRRGDFADVLDLHMAAYPLVSLAAALERRDPNLKELCQLVPVRVVACIEGGMKSGLATLVDRGEPYRSRAREIVHRQVQIDFDVLAAVMTDRVRLGELVAHTLSYHDLAKIDSAFSGLLGQSFFEAVRTARNRWPESVDGATAPIITDLDSVLGRIAEAIRLRNSLCHEIAAFVEIDPTDARALLDAGREFLEASAWVISETLHPNAPLTQADMTDAAWRDADAVDASIGEQIQSLLSDADPDDAVLLSQAVELWRQFRHAFAEFEGNVAKGGSLAPQLRGMANARLGRSLLAELETAHHTRNMEDPAPRRVRQ
jgi:hypothetical protein